jgi:hypothetical protein
MNEKKYCRMRHETTRDEVQLAEDYFSGVHMIRTFFAEAHIGMFREINRQPCHNEENFEHLWNETIRAYQRKGWKDID